MKIATPFTGGKMGIQLAASIIEAQKAGTLTLNFRSFPESFLEKPYRIIL